MKTVNTKFVRGRSRARNFATSCKPFCDLLKLYPLDKWKKQGVGPPIRYITANDINSRVLCIEGTVTGSNSIILPFCPEKILGLGYSFIYFLLRPIVDKGFILQLDVKTFDNLDLRITLSNVFNDIKVTNLSLHLPLVPCSNSYKNNHNVQNLSGWTFVKLNIPEVLSVYNKRKFVCLSRIQICSSVLLRSIFVSDLNYSPLVSRENTCSGRYKKLGQYPIPREIYSSNSKDNDILRTVHNISFPMDPSCSDSVPTKLKSSVCNQLCMDEKESVNSKPVFQVPLGLPLHGVNTGGDLSSDCQYGLRMKVCSGSDASKSNDEEKSTPVTSIDDPSCKIMYHEDRRSSTDESCETTSFNKARVKRHFREVQSGSEFEPPRLDLIHISACPTSCAKLLITPNGKACIFPCEAFVVLVDMDDKSQHQVGHTDTVMGLCMDPDGTMLASCQSSSAVGVVHVWRMPLLEKQGCRKTEHPIGTGRANRIRALRGVHLSKMGEFLFAFGEDPSGRGSILLWDVRSIGWNTALPLIARCNTDRCLQDLYILPSVPDCPSQAKAKYVVLRFFTCSQSGLRLWRLRTSRNSAGSLNTIKNAQLTSTPVHLQLPLGQLTDCCIKPIVQVVRTVLEDGEEGAEELNGYSVVACSTTGYIIEFNPDMFEVSAVYRLTTRPQGGSAELHVVQNTVSNLNERGEHELLKTNPRSNGVNLTQIKWVHLGPGTLDGWLVTGSTDGCMRLWNIDGYDRAPKLEVTYAGSIRCLAVCTLKPELGKSPKSDDLEWFSKATISLATETGGLACINVSGRVSDQNMEKKLCIEGCSPRRIMAWQLDGPILSADTITCDPTGATSVVATLSIKGSIRIWKLSKMKVENTQVDFTSEGLSGLQETPLFDLCIPGDMPTCLALQPIGPASQNDTPETEKFTWLRLACGYPNSGLIRIFAPSTAELSVESMHHGGQDISALHFTCCGSFLYTADSSGQIACWKVPRACVSDGGLADTSGSNCLKLLTSSHRQVAVFTVEIPVGQIAQKMPFKLTVSRSVLALCPDRKRLAYIGPSSLLITIVQALTLECLVQLDLEQLDRIHFPDYPDPFLGYMDCSYLAVPHLLCFDGRISCSDEYNLVVGTAGGHLFRLDGIDGKVLACAKFNEHTSQWKVENGEGSDKQAKQVACWSTMCVTPDGHGLILADATRPILYTTSIELNSVGTQCKISDYSYAQKDLRLTYRKFIGHLHPITCIMVTLGHQPFCVTIDRPSWKIIHRNNTYGSGVFVWRLLSLMNFNQDVIRLESNNRKLSATPSPPLEAKTQLIGGGKTDSIGPPTAGIYTECKQSATLNGICDGQLEVYIPPSKSYRHVRVVDQCQVPNLKNLPTASELDAMKLTESQLHLVCISEGQNGLRASFIGFANHTRAVNNLVWNPDSGLFVYTSKTDSIGPPTAGIYTECKQSATLNGICDGQLEVYIPPSKSYRHVRVVDQCQVPNLKNLPTASELDAMKLTESQLHLVCISEGQNGLRASFIGFANHTRAVNNLVWNPDSGLFVYTSDAFLVCESLETSIQKVYGTEFTKPETLKNPPVFMGESLNGLALSPNHRMFAVGATALWSFTDHGDQSDGYERSIFTSTIIIIPVKEYSRLEHKIWTSSNDRRTMLDHTESFRFSYSRILSEACSVQPSKAKCPLLANMCFNSNSRFLVTISSCRLSIVGIWCTRQRTLLAHLSTNGFVNQITCSSIVPSEFVTVGCGINVTDRIEFTNPKPLGQLLFWNMLGADCLTYQSPGNTSDNRNQCPEELSAVVYLAYPASQDHCSTLSFRGGSVVQELLAVSSIRGVITLWDPRSRSQLFFTLPEQEEIGVLSVCGPSGLVSGSASGCLRLWRIELPGDPERDLFEHIDHGNLSMSNVSLRLVKELSRLEGTSESYPITVAFFDLEGQMGVVGTGDSTLWYVNWSEVELAPSRLSEHRTQLVDSDASASRTRLFSGHASTIYDLQWWFPSVSPVGTVCSQKNIGLTSEEMIVTSSADGKIRVWDSQTRELVSQLQVTSHTFADTDHSSPTCFAVLNYSKTSFCEQHERTDVCGSGVHVNFHCTGCLAVGFTNTCVKLFCLHRVHATAQLGSMASRTSDPINQIRFIGPSHLILGTRGGLLILIAIKPLQASTKLTVTRVMKDHALENVDSHGILALDVYSHSFNHNLDLIEQELDISQVNRAVNLAALNPSGLNKKRIAIHKQTNLSTLSDESSSENAERWIWLALGEDKRLSIWVLVDRVARNDAVSFHRNPPKFARCHLIRWILLDSLRIFSELLPQVPDQPEKCLNIFRVSSSIRKTRSGVWYKSRFQLYHIVFPNVGTRCASDCYSCSN
ncbi:hypothetical protein AHF37_02593 [Paragonimus kellicotti]|nr:hypothetical protein AHF37_02593 [Paragonimus kellicotti]